MDQPLAKRSRRESENNDLMYGCNECIDAFPSKIKLDEHLIGTHERSITVLSNEVVEHILKFLHPNDLARLSHTCRSYKNLVPQYFQRMHQCGWVDIICERGIPKFGTNQKEEYEKVFRKIICNVKIFTYENESLTEMFKFIKANCSKNILSLALQGYISTRVTESHVDIIGEQIMHLKRLALKVSTICNIQWNRFRNLRMLYDASCGDHMWQSEKFSKLHTLFFTSDRYNPDNLTRFFENNKQLETLSCFGPKALQSVSNSGINLSNLLLNFECEDDQETLNAMERCYDQIELFDIVVNSIPILNGIYRMEKVKRIHCYFNKEEYRKWTVIGGIVGINIEAIDTQLPHIQWLHADFHTLRKEELVTLVKLFPNVSKLWINYYYYSSELPPNKIISILVDGLPKLQDLYLVNMFKFRGENYDLRNWTSSRLSMENAPNITVHVEEADKSYFDSVGFKTNGVTIKAEKICDIECRRCSIQIESQLDYLEDLRN